MNQATEKEFLSAYDAYADALYKHCFFRVYSRTRAEELVQDTFMKTWDYLGKGKEIENLRAFLYKTANNLIIDYSRKKREISLEQELEEKPGWEPADDRPTLEHNLLLQQVRDSLKQLPEEARQLLTWRYIDDLDPKDIAEILDVTPNNVSVKLNRALQLLKSLYQETVPKK
jgi:RNA polymerase sigma factor (sigma-70 family)